MKKHLLLFAAAMLLALPASAATGVSADTLVNNGAQSYPGCDCYTYNGQLYTRQEGGGYGVASGDTVTPTEATGNETANTIEVPQRPSADVRPDGRRDYRLTCPAFRNDPTLENCRTYYEPRSR